MPQIADWLEKLGMSEYARRFAENRIDFSVLPDLTDHDLEKLGVVLGDRRKMLRAIANLEATEKSAPPIAAPATASAVPVGSHDTAERRQVTVMFSDLVGSTALSARIDPEDLREVISAYQKCVAEIVQRFGGFVAKYMGDGVLIYFGYPQAHEDDAERAVRAGLELVTAVTALKTHARLQTRVGIATGLVVVGDLIGSGASQEQAIVGETPNLAARLQGIAEPNSVVIGESARKLLGNLFELRDLGAQRLKGIAGHVRAWAALRPASVESRFDALHTSGLTELVGREEELELLLRRWSKGKGNQGQGVLLSGEPGIGKSRLTAALLERLAAEPHTRLRYFCSPRHTESALYPIISQMERTARYTYADSGQVKLDKLGTLLSLSSTSKQDAALFAEMLSLTNDGRYPSLGLTPQERRQKTLEALFAQVETFARNSPVLMIFEDAHWSDPTSLEAFGRAVDRIATLPVLLLITFRPEFNPPWIGQPHVTCLTLNRLTRGEAQGLIDRVAGNKPLAANIRQDIIERTDGIPLFVEEMTKAVLEAESQRVAEHAVAAIPFAAVAVPATLHASLMARLDRLGGAAKEVAQIAAALGREFSYSLLAAVVGKPDAELERTLERIVAAGLLFRQGVPPYATYLFKHALVQDAAYGTLLREPRRALHAQIVDTLESRFAEIANNQPELLAHHCTAAGLIERAASLWGKAGRRSWERSALAEAVAQLTRSLDQIAVLPGTPARRREQIEFQVALGYVLMSTRGFAAPETLAAFEKARSFIERADTLGEVSDNRPMLAVLSGFWLASYVGFNGDAMRELAAQFLTLAENEAAMVPLMAHRQMGVSLLRTGDVTAGRAHFDRAVALWDHAERSLETPTKKEFWARLLTPPPAMLLLADRSLAMWTLGYPEAALADAQRAVRNAPVGHVAWHSYTVRITATILMDCGNYAEASAQIDEAIARTEEAGALYWKWGVTLLKGCLFVLTGKSAEAVQVMTPALDAWRSMGSKAALPRYLAHLATAYADSGQFEDAWRCIDEAMLTIKTTKESICEPEVDHLGGELALKSPEPDAAKAEAHFKRALAVARQQQAKSWELRAAMSMARLWRDQGKPQQARELLAPVYGWFTEGFDTRDLKDAKALLDEL